MSEKILIFGPTGTVALAAALHAHTLGATIYLAMRDPNKTIPDLPKEDEEKFGFTRVKADLSDPTSLKEAVKTSGATSAFVYTLHQEKDYMKASFEALESTGIKYVALLSSWSVQPTAQEGTKLSFIPAIHAHTELALASTNLSYTAVRPAFFNTNILWYKPGILSGSVSIFGGESRFDKISPTDIGHVFAVLLTDPSSRPPAAKPWVYLCGVEILSQAEGIKLAGKVMGKDVEVKELSEEEYVKTSSHLPEPVLRSIMQSTKENTPPNDGYKALYEEGTGNLRKYLGREPEMFREWLERNKKVFE